MSGRRLPALAPVNPAASDGDLLREYSETRHDAVFAAIVRRHGPMVQGVCQRVTSHAQDADDAFQATFLTLAVRAASAPQADRFAGWLFVVARNAAVEVV